MIWIIEQKNKLGLWVPTVGAGLTRGDAIREIDQYWKVNYPEDHFRAKKYISA
jgi:hypothetical protein